MNNLQSNVDTLRVVRLGAAHELDITAEKAIYIFAERGQCFCTMIEYLKLMEHVDNLKEHKCYNKVGEGTAERVPCVVGHNLGIA